MRYVEIIAGFSWLRNLIEEINRNCNTKFNSMQFKFGNIELAWKDYFAVCAITFKGTQQDRINILREGGIDNSGKLTFKSKSIFNNPQIEGICIFSYYFYKNTLDDNDVRFGIKSMNDVDTLEVILHEIAHFLYFKEYMKQIKNTTTIQEIIQNKASHSDDFKNKYISLLNIPYTQDEILDLIKQIKANYNIIGNFKKAHLNNNGTLHS